MEITSIRIFRCVFSLVTYIADVGSDIYVAVKHYQEGNWTYFYLTVVFIVLPAIMVSIANSWWYSKGTSAPRLLKARGAADWRIRIIFSILMAPAYRYAEAIYYGWKSRKSQTAVMKESYARATIFHLSGASVLMLFEAFFESVPQLFLQIYIIAQMHCDGSNYISTTEIVQFTSIVISLISVAFTMVSQVFLRHKSIKEMKWYSSVFFFLWRFFEIASRVVTLGVFASVLLPYFFLVCGIHFCVMLLWLRFMHTDCLEDKIAEYSNKIVLSLMNILCFLNPINCRSLLKCRILYYSIVFVENAALISVWYHLCAFGYRLPVLCMVFVCFVLAVIFMVFYNVLLHPTRGRLFREPNPEERIDYPFTMERWLIERLICTGMSDAVIETGKPTEENSTREEVMERSPLSKSVIHDFSLNSDLIDKSGKVRGTSEEMQTAVIENGKPTEENSTTEEVIKCSQL